MGSRSFWSIVTELCARVGVAPFVVAIVLLGLVMLALFRAVFRDRDLSSHQRRLAGAAAFMLLALLLTAITARAIGSADLANRGLFGANQYGDKTPIPAGWKLKSLADGKIVDFDSFKGKAVVVNFWATWCPPCVAELADFQVLYDRHRDDRTTAFLFITLDKDPDDAIEYCKAKRLNLPLYAVVDPTSTPVKLRSQFIPATFFFDKTLAIRDKVEGQRPWQDASVSRRLNRLASE